MERLEALNAFLGIVLYGVEIYRMVLLFTSKYHYLSVGHLQSWEIKTGHERYPWLGGA